MGERSDLPRLYIAVNPSKLRRCDWCGTIESDNWIQGQYRGNYCNSLCLHARKNKEFREVLVIMVISWLLLTPLLVMTRNAIAAILISFIAIPGILCGIYRIRMSEAAIEKVPKDSRRTEVLEDIALLKTMLTHVECPNCDGNIDVNTIESDQIYHCSYCGASGIIEITMTGKK